MWALFRPVLLVCGILMWIIAGLMLLVATFAWLRHDPEMDAFVSSGTLVALTGLILVITTRGGNFHLTARQLYLLTTMSWLSSSIISALPLFFSSLHLSFVDAVFEAVSGITTTGSTVLPDIESLSPSLLLWRSMLQWMGGLGFIGMAVTILPFLQIGGMRLFQTESSDWSDKSMPRFQHLAHILLLTYLGLSLACLLAYWASGMSLFDAINHAMATVSTGGFGTDDRSLGRFGLDTLWVSTLFMLLGATPFILIIAFFHRARWSSVRNSQFLTFLAIVGSVSLALGTWLWWHGLYSPVEAYTHATFNIVSVITTTGFASTDYTLWGHFSIAIFFLLTFIGGCSGSTAGGLKIFRLQLGYLFMRNQFRKLVHPQGVFVAQYNGKAVSDDIILSAVSFTFLFFLCLAVCTLILGLLGLDLVTSVTAVATAMSNVGPGLGAIIGPAGNFAPLPDAAKWLLCFAMILGRLELLTVMVLLTPVFWRD